MLQRDFDTSQWGDHAFTIRMHACSAQSVYSYRKLNMTEPKQHSSSPSPPPHVQLIQMGTAYWASRAVYAAAKLGLADQLKSGTKSAEELAGAVGAHAPLCTG